MCSPLQRETLFCKFRNCIKRARKSKMCFPQQREALFLKNVWSKTAAADLAKPPFRGQKSDSFERKCSKSFSKIVLPMQARTTFFKKCHAKSELDRKNHERCILKLAFFDAQSMCIMIAMNSKFVKIENVFPAAAGSTFLKAACSICVSNAIL